MKYRKRPVVIEAMRWTGTPESASEVIGWVSGAGGTARLTDFQRAYDDGEMGCPDSPAFVMIDTLEGSMQATAGDWIIRGVQGEFYPCKPDIFDATYEPVSDDA